MEITTFKLKPPGHGKNASGYAIAMTDPDFWSFYHSQSPGVTVTCLKVPACNQALLVLNTPHLDSGTLGRDFQRAIEDVFKKAERYVQGQRAQGNLFSDMEEGEGQ